MTVRLDPEGSEIRALNELIDLSGLRVLEIGSGDGRLTWRFADRAARVAAIEPFKPSYEKARSAMPDSLRTTVELQNCSLMDFAAQTPSEAFDATILSWSLC